MRTPGKRVCRKATRVRIPAHPPALFIRARLVLDEAMRFLLAAVFLSSAFLAHATDQNVGADPVERARREFQSGKMDAALTLLDEAEKDGSKNGHSLDLRGCVLLEQGKFDDAIKAFEASFEADPKWIGHLHVGDALRRQEKWEEARAAYRKVFKETDILVLNERLRFAEFITFLGAKDEEKARQSLDRLTIPTESAAYYYAQAAWSFAHGKNREAQDWLKHAQDIYPAKSTAWFARHLYDFGWLKTKPQPVAE
jgi:tetratricopeptide (TPR) repeat protein